MQHEGGLAGPPIDDQHNSTDQSPELGIGRSIRPRTAVPPTLLVAEMSDGSLLLHGWRDGPSAYLCPADAAPLKRALAAAFGSAELTLRAEEGEPL